MLSNTFNTTQFISVKNDYSRKGNTVYQDLKNPGDYYLTTPSGFVYLINSTMVIHENNNTFTRETETKRHCINPRNFSVKSDQYKKLNQIDMLARMQYISNKRSNKTQLIQHKDNINNTTTRYIPNF